MGTLLRWGQPAVTNVSRGRSIVAGRKRTGLKLKHIVPQKIVNNAAPVFGTTDIPDQSYATGVAITPLDISAYFTNATAYSMTIPVSGLVFDTATGILSGTPDSLGSYNPKAGATNEYGSAESNVFNISVS